MVLVRKRCPDVPLVGFQYSLCRVVLMVGTSILDGWRMVELSVLALSSRFDGPDQFARMDSPRLFFQYSLCRVVLMVESIKRISSGVRAFSTRSVESF